MTNPLGADHFQIVSKEVIVFYAALMKMLSPYRSSSIVVDPLYKGLVILNFQQRNGQDVRDTYLGDCHIRPFSKGMVIT